MIRYFVRPSIKVIISPGPRGGRGRIESKGVCMVVVVFGGWRERIEGEDVCTVVVVGGGGDSID